MTSFSQKTPKEQLRIRLDEKANDYVSFANEIKSLAVESEKMSDNAQNTLLKVFQLIGLRMVG